MKFTKKWLFAFVLIALLAASCGSRNQNDGFLPEATETPQEQEPTSTPGVAVEPEMTATSRLDPTGGPDAAPDGGTSGPAAGVAAVPPEVERYADDWPMGNKDYSNTRASLNAGIDSGNVAELDIAWVYEIQGIGAYGGAATTPLIAGGVVYFQDMNSNVIALDLESGEIVWEHREEANVIGPNGIALGYGKVFAQGGENNIFALDIETGELVWESTMEGPSGSQQPYVYGGYVLTAAVAGAVLPETAGAALARRGYMPGHSGIIYAIDQETGEFAWRFQVVEEGFWGHPEINGGGGVWYPPAVDVDNNVTFWGTGNPAPFPGIVGWPNAASRPGPNLYTSAVVALDLHSGDLLWYNQAKPGDLFDLDFQISPILATGGADGRERDIVIGSGKVGRVIGMDRQSGGTLWDTLVGVHENDELDELPEGEEVKVFPGVWGGVETPMAYADGVVYANVLNLGTPYTADGFGAADGSEAVNRASGRTQLPEGTSELVAIDAATGEILWNVEYGEPGFGAATVVNDLVFTSTHDGTIYAHAREDGREVWSFKGPGGIIAWPAVAGDTIIFPFGVGENPVVAAFRVGAAGVDVPRPAPTLAPTP